MALRHRPCVSREPWLFRGDCGSDDGDFRAVTHAPRHLSFDSSDPHLPVVRDRLYPRSICCGGCGSRCVARVRTQSDAFFVRLHVTVLQPCGLDHGRSLRAIDADCARRASADPIQPRPYYYGKTIRGVGPAFRDIGRRAPARWLGTISFSKSLSLSNCDFGRRRQTTLR